MTNTCDCTRPCADAFACTECAKAAVENLRHIADLTAALDEKRAKVRSNWDVSNIGAARPVRRWRTDDNQVTTFAASPHFTPSAALGFDPRVSKVADRIHNGLVGIVRDVFLTHGSLAADASSATIAQWLKRHVHDIRMTDTASETFDLISRMVGDLHHLFDNPPPALFLGECKAEFEDGECTQSLYLDADKVTSTEVACPRCGITHDVAERRKVLMEGVNDYTGTAKEISHLLRLVGGTDVTERRIREYAAHGMLPQKGTRLEFNNQGHPHNAATYRIGDVREILDKLQDRRAQQRADKIRRRLLDKTRGQERVC